MNTLELKKMANEVRKGIVTAVHSAKSGHPGGTQCCDSGNGRRGAALHKGAGLV